MSTPMKLLITGATGFIGGQILHDLLALNKYDITALIRDEKRAEQLKIALGPSVKTVVGDLDTPQLPEIASHFDVILHLASSDHPKGAAALANGLEQRAQQNSPHKPLLIHTSGTAVIADNAMGRYKSDQVYSDDDLTSYHALPKTAWHKTVDDIVLEAGGRGIIDTIIICPPLIWGTGKGVFNQRSIQILGMIRAFLAAGKGYTVNEGANVWGKVHISDISQLYLTVLEAALRGDIPSNPRDRYYFGEADEFVIADAAKVVTEELVKKGALASAEVVRVEGGMENEEVKGIVMLGLTSNSRSKAVKARKLGWTPKYVGNEGFFEDARELVDYALSSK